MKIIFKNFPKTINHLSKIRHAHSKKSLPLPLFTLPQIQKNIIINSIISKQNLVIPNLIIKSINEFYSKHKNTI